MLSVKDKVKAVVIGTLAGAIFGVTANAVLDIPDVYWSNNTNECVSVKNYANGDSYTCNNLPSKYNKVWVQ